MHILVTRVLLKRRWVLKYQHNKSLPSKKVQELQLFAMNSPSTANTESIMSSERTSVHSRRVCVKVSFFPSHEIF